MQPRPDRPPEESLGFRWMFLGAVGAALLWAGIAASAAQQLPPGSSVPSVRRGTNGQIEIAPPNAPVRPGISRRDAAPAATAPRAALPAAGPTGASIVVRGSVASPPKPVKSVEWTIPKVPDTTPRE